VLTGNPVAPEKLRAARKPLDIREKSVATRAVRYAEVPRDLIFNGERSFESPLKSPAGILLFAFAPLLVLAGSWRPRTGAQWACVLFTVIYLLYWAFILLKVRYAITPFACLGLLMAALTKRFYDAQKWRVVGLSLIAVETFALVFAVMGLMIIEINGPQFAYFAGRLDKPGYLRAAMQTYGSVEYLKHSAGPDASVYGVDNFTRAYAPAPWKFDAMWCSPESCVTSDVVAQVKKSGARYAILPENPAILPEILDGLGRPERLYQDPYFSVYQLRP
jgi:hypothetical protein